MHLHISINVTFIASKQYIFKEDNSILAAKFISSWSTLSRIVYLSSLLHFSSKTEALGFAKIVVALNISDQLGGSGMSKVWILISIDLMSPIIIFYEVRCII